MTDLAEQSGGEDIDVDKILEGVNAPEERAMTSEAAAPQQTEPAKPTVQEYEYEWRGQKVKEPLDTILKRASMGRDYAQNTEALKRERSEWENQRKSWEEKFNPYKEIDEYARKNRDWWDHVQNSYKTREQPQLDPSFKPILDELNQVKSVLTEYQTEKQQQQMRAEDEAFDKEIQGIREKYPDLPWETPDQEGKSLIYKVLKHGTENGIKSFKTAFMDFYHPELEKRWESRGREAVVKDTQKKTKMGLLGESPAPKSGLSKAQNVKGRSYDQLAKEALEELGIG